MQKWVQTLTGLMMSAFLALGLGAKARAQTPEDALPENAPTEAVAPAEEGGSAAAQSQTQQQEAIPETDGKETTPEAQQETAGSSAGTDVTTPEAAGTDTTPPSVGTEIPGTPGTAETPVPPAPADETAVAAASVPGQDGLSPLSDSTGMTGQAVIPAPADGMMITLSAPLDATPLSMNSFALTSVGASPAPAGSSGEDDTDSSTSGTPVITVGSTEVDGSEDVTGTNWRYLAESGRLVMINYDGSAGNVVTGENGAEILAAGINRIGTLSCSGDVTILGTGILLVDDVQMIGESTLSLQTNTNIYSDGTGSVALFLKTGENEYTLANGTEATGILDEEYNIEGITLIVPSEGVLLLNSIGAQKDPETGKTEYYFGSDKPETCFGEGYVTESTSNLIIGDGASLRVESGGWVLMKTLASNILSESYYRPLLKTEGTGTLSVDGNVQGDGLVSLLNTEGGLSGSGEIQAHLISLVTEIMTGNSVTLTGYDTEVFGSAPVETMTVSDVMVMFNQAVEVKSITSTGKTVLNMIPGSVIDDVDVTGTLTIRQQPDPNTGWDSIPKSSTVTGKIAFTGNVTGGGTVEFDGGSVRIEETATVENGTVCSRSATVLDYSAAGITEMSTIPLSVSPDNVPHPGEDGLVPVTAAFIEVCRYTDPPRRTTSVEINRIIDVEASSVEAPAIYATGTINLGALKTYADKLVAAEPNGSGLYLTADSHPYQVEIVRTLAGTLRVDTYGAGGLTGTVSGEGVDMIRVIIMAFSTNPNAGTSVTQTSTTFTGSGILGGAGAGSVHGGQSHVLFRGTSSNPSHDPNEDPDPNSDPGTDPASTADTQPAPAAGLRVVVKPDEGGLYTLELLDGTTGERVPERHVEVRTRFTPPVGWNTDDIFVVFRNEDGTLTAIKARYDAVTGMLIFETDLTGLFSVVSFSFEGEQFSEEFYTALEALEAIRALPVRR